MTKLTTHVLDVYSGKPGDGVKVELYYLKNNDRKISDPVHRAKSKNAQCRKCAT